MIRLERRLNQPRWLGTAALLGALLIALCISGLVMLVTGHNPITTYHSMLDAGFISNGAFSATLASATPLLFTGLCAAIAFRMRLYNIGGEGQLYVGAIGAAGVALVLGGQPGIVVIPATIAAGCLSGALWAWIPGVLRAYLHTNEILTSLMLNYVAGLLASYLILDSTSYWRDLSSAAATGEPQGKMIAPSAWWPVLHLGGLSVPFGFVVGAVVAAALLLILRYTRFGFQLRVMADSPAASRYAGMRTRRTIVVVMLVSGGLAGLAGASQIGDFSHTLDPNGLQQAVYGYTGIVAAALARFTPLAVIVSSVFLGALTNAGLQLQGATFPQGLVGTIEGIILFCVVSAEVMSRYRIAVGRRTAGVVGGSGEGMQPPAEQTRPTGTTSAIAEVTK